MNNFVGHVPVHLFGERVALGTDGFPADMFEEARTGFFKNQDMRFGIQDARFKIQDVDFAGLLQGGQGLISEIFKQEFGTLQQGSAADFTVLDYQPPTPVTKENVGGHFLFGMRSANVESVMVNGKWIVWNRQLPGIDVQDVMARATKAAKKLWKNMERLKA